MGMYGIFLLVATLTLQKKKIDQSVLIIQVLLPFISNVFTMVELLWYSNTYPLGLGNHIVRLYFLHMEDAFLKSILWVPLYICWDWKGMLYCASFQFLCSKENIRLVNQS